MLFYIMQIARELDVEDGVRGKPMSCMETPDANGKDMLPLIQRWSPI